mmetsp:Transcript_36398/g.77428  ORF Transcript_36398/g.77428 Transcript_36398/m.77428 type:complete len:219 (-) Transcript_36398:221-877(-)
MTTPKLVLPWIADDLLPSATSEAMDVGAAAISRSEQLERMLGDMNLHEDKDTAELSQLYEVVDRLRTAAKDAQALVDKAMATSHTFFPLIESAYSCAGADKALQMAHRLHLKIGRIKDAIGNPPGGTGGHHGIGEDGLGNGAADLLAGLERDLGPFARSQPGALHPMNLEVDSVDEATLFALLMAQQARRRGKKMTAPPEVWREPCPAIGAMRLSSFL